MDKINNCHSCSCCKFFIYTEEAKPYFTCSKNVWENIQTEDEVDNLSRNNDCNLFKLKEKNDDRRY